MFRAWSRMIKRCRRWAAWIVAEAQWSWERWLHAIQNPLADDLAVVYGRPGRQGSGMRGWVRARSMLQHAHTHGDITCMITDAPIRWYIATGSIRQRPSRARNGSIPSDWMTPMDILRNVGPDRMRLLMALGAIKRRRMDIPIHVMIAHLACVHDLGWHVSHVFLQKEADDDLIHEVVLALMDRMAMSASMPHHQDILAWMMPHGMAHDPIRMAMLIQRCDMSPVQTGLGSPMANDRRPSDAHDGWHRAMIPVS